MIWKNTVLSDAMLNRPLPEQLAYRVQDLEKQFCRMLLDIPLVYTIKDYNYDNQHTEQWD